MRSPKTGTPINKTSSQHSKLYVHQLKIALHIQKIIYARPPGQSTAPAVYVCLCAVLYQLTLNSQRCPLNQHEARCHIAAVNAIAFRGVCGQKAPKNPFDTFYMLI